MILKEFIKQEANKNFEEVVAFRRELHENPELSYKEKETSQRILRELKKLPVDDIRTNVGGYGILATLYGNNPDGKTILLRADFDALPIHEQSGVSFASKNPGVMHACGHDLHSANLLGTAKILCELKDQLEGNIVFCFQPAEEASPTGGAKKMIEDGALENPTVDAAVGYHIIDKPTGSIAAKKGVATANSNPFEIVIRGESAHGAQPQNGKDAIITAAQVMMSLQTIVSRNISPFEPVVISFGTIHGGDRYNVIADEVVIEGTCRIFDEELSADMDDRMEKIIRNVTEAMGCTYEFEYHRGYKSVYNDPELTDLVFEAGSEQLGEKHISEEFEPSSGSEDFSAFSREVPAVFATLGGESDWNEGRVTVHSSNFNPDEEALRSGTQSLAAIAVRYLNGEDALTEEIQNESGHLVNSKQSVNN